MVIVRLLLFVALAAIGGALALYLIRRDRRYLTFIVQVLKFTLILLAVVLLLFAAERLLAPVIGPLLQGPPAASDFSGSAQARPSAAPAPASPAAARAAAGSRYPIDAERIVPMTLA